MRNSRAKFAVLQSVIRLYPQTKIGISKPKYGLSAPFFQRALLQQRICKIQRQLKNCFSRQQVGSRVHGHIWYVRPRSLNGVLVV